MRLGWLATAERVTAVAANVATLAALLLAVAIFRQDIADRLLGRPLLVYKLDYMETLYRDGISGEFVHAVNSGRYGLIIRNRGREPALKVKISVNAFGILRRAHENFSPDDQWRDPYSTLVRRDGGIGHGGFYYELDRLRPGGFLYVGFARENECTIDLLPAARIEYEDEKGTQFTAAEESSRKRPNLRELRDGGADCDLPPLDRIESADRWTPEMVYHVRVLTRRCGIQATMPELLRLTARLSSEFRRPSDASWSPVLCDTLRRLISE